MTDNMNVPAVQVANNAPAPSKPVAKKAAVRKPKAGNKAELSLTTVTNANGTPNLVLSSTMKVKFPELVLVKQTDVNAKNPVPVFDNKELGDLVHFIEAIVTSYTGGTGIASDGATLYVDSFADHVLKVVPQVKTYDVLFSTSQSGAVKNRVPVIAMVEMAKARAKYVRQSIQKYGLTKTAHNRKSTAPSTVVLI